MGTGRDSRTRAASFGSRMERRQDVSAQRRPTAVFPAQEDLDPGQGYGCLAAFAQDRRREVVGGDPGRLRLVLWPARVGRVGQQSGGPDRVNGAGGPCPAGRSWPSKRPGVPQDRSSCPKSRKSHSRTRIGKENRDSRARPHGMTAFEMPEITHPGCPKSRAPASELPEITKQNLHYPQNHVARSSTATRFSVTWVPNIGPDRPESPSSGRCVILGRTAGNRDLRQKWRR